MTYIPNIASEYHRIGHPAGNLGRPERESVVPNFSGGERPQRAAVLVAITTGAVATHAELEAVVALAVGAPEWVAVAPPTFVAAGSVRQLVSAVPVPMSPHSQVVGRFHPLELQEGGREGGRFSHLVLEDRSVYTAQALVYTDCMCLVAKKANVKANKRKKSKILY